MTQLLYLHSISTILFQFNNDVPCAINVQHEVSLIQENVFWSHTQTPLKNSIWNDFLDTFGYLIGKNVHYVIGYLSYMYMYLQCTCNRHLTALLSNIYIKSSLQRTRANLCMKIAPCFRIVAHVAPNSKKKGATLNII